MRAQIEAGLSGIVLRLLDVDDVPWSVLDDLDGARVVVDIVGSVVVVGKNAVRLVDDVNDQKQMVRAISLTQKIAVDGAFTINGTRLEGMTLDIVELVPLDVVGVE